MFGKILKYGTKALIKMIGGEKKPVSAEDIMNQDDDEWHYSPKHYPAMVKMIKRYEAEHAVIKVSWEAGGDECPVYCTVNGKADYPPEDEKLFNKICSLIIQELDLPGAGEIYNNGFGQLYTKEDKLFIRTTYTYYEYYYEDEEEGVPSSALRLNIQLPDPFGWESLLKRADLQVSASLDNKGIFDLRLWLNIRNGDDYDITEEQEKFYEDFLRKEFEKFKPEFSKTKSGHPLYKVSLWHTMRNSMLLNAVVESSYIEIHDEAENREIELVQ